MLGRLRRRDVSAPGESAKRFAVVDLETTGLFASRHHRVIEIAIVDCDHLGRPESAFATLINPGRDLGPTDIHGIRARDIAEAPTFADVVGDVCERLRGRVLVAHNARFDHSFLDREFQRAGYRLPDGPWVCTMEIAGESIGVRRLRSCCEELEIEVGRSHSARDDAWATARLLATCLERHGAQVVVNRTLEQTPIPPDSAWPNQIACGRVAERAEGRPPRRETYVTELLDRLEPRPGAVDGASHAYLELLDRVLEDRVMTADEADGLAELAGEWGIGTRDCRRLHDEYMAALVAIAWRDGVVTDAERADLEDVAALLKIDTLALAEMLEAPFVDQAAQELPTNSSEWVGRTVCFTGQLTCTISGRSITRDHAQALAEQHGLIVQNGVTKKLDILVVADPDTLSGKAKKARDYGTRLVVERNFWRSIGVPVD